MRAVNAIQILSDGAMSMMPRPKTPLLLGWSKRGSVQSNKLREINFDAKITETAGSRTH